MVLTGAIVACLIVSTARAQSDTGYVAHEWGTFTCVQGGNGVPLAWRSVQISELPQFVYNWARPGLQRTPIAGLASGKGGITSLQRMETPVIYFYSDREQTVDISVRFPKGRITEWYPQAARVGPCVPVGMNGTAPNPYSASDSRIEWRDVKLLVPRNPTRTRPAATLSHRMGEGRGEGNLQRVSWADQQGAVSSSTATSAAACLPMDQSGSHYFAARDTDSAFLSVPTFTSDSSGPETEKFLFYRGIGNFQTPLRVMMNTEGEVTLKALGTNSLGHLLVLRVENGRGKCVLLDSLASGETKTISLGAEKELSKDQLTNTVETAMRDALVSKGLFPREATAMVNTWKDTWFSEDGVRVLYVLPRAWTDATLPIQFTPAPRKLVRVMIGRAEVIPPALVSHLRNEMARSNRGENAARDQLSVELKKLGRFWSAALTLANRQGHEDPFE